jgi:hypothetical protein
VAVLVVLSTTQAVAVVLAVLVQMQLTNQLVALEHKTQF